MLIIENGNRWVSSILRIIAQRLLADVCKFPVRELNLAGVESGQRHRAQNTLVLSSR